MGKNGDGDTSFATQSEGDGVWVGVRSGGVDHNSGKQVASEFIIDQKGGSHIHIGLDEDGEEIFRSER